VTVKEYVPAGTPAVVPTLRLVVLLSPATPESEEGVKVGVAPVGNPEVLKVTLQVVPLPPNLTVTGLNVAEPPATTGLED
jgi:hypothetical protein